MPNFGENNFYFILVVFQKSDDPWVLVGVFVCMILIVRETGQPSYTYFSEKIIFLGLNVLGI